MSLLALPSSLLRIIAAAPGPDTSARPWLRNGPQCGSFHRIYASAHTVFLLRQVCRKTRYAFRNDTPSLCQVLYQLAFHGHTHVLEWIISIGMGWMRFATFALKCANVQWTPMDRIVRAALNSECDYKLELLNWIEQVLADVFPTQPATLMRDLVGYSHLKLTEDAAACGDLAVFQWFHDRNCCDYGNVETENEELKLELWINSCVSLDIFIWRYNQVAHATCADRMLEMDFRSNTILTGAITQGIQGNVLSLVDWAYGIWVEKYGAANAMNRLDQLAAPESEFGCWGLGINEATEISVVQWLHIHNLVRHIPDETIVEWAYLSTLRWMHERKMLPSFSGNDSVGWYVLNRYHTRSPRTYESVCWFHSTFPELFCTNHYAAMVLKDVGRARGANPLVDPTEFPAMSFFYRMGVPYDSSIVKAAFTLDRFDSLGTHLLTQCHLAIDTFQQSLAHMPVEPARKQARH